MQLTAALGPEVVRVADRLQQCDGRADAALWRDLLQALYSTNADVMETPLGQLFTFAVVGRINGERGAGYPATLSRTSFRARG
jgi:hypothetical protein